jgi:ribosomal protein L25 (general stress protein Ctc)
MAGIVLNVEKRDRTGTGGARATRKADLIPGVLYGGKRGSIPIEIKAKDVEMALRSGKFLSHMVELNHQGEKQPVIPRKRAAPNHRASALCLCPRGLPLPEAKTMHRQAYPIRFPEAGKCPRSHLPIRPTA